MQSECQCQTLTILPTKEKLNGYILLYWTFDVNANMELTIEPLLPFLRPTKTWPHPVDRAHTIINLQSFIDSGNLSDELVRELFSDIPPNLFSVVAQHHLVCGIEKVTDWYAFLERLCDLIYSSELAALQDLKDSKLFGMIQKDARERLRKANWLPAMSKRLAVSLGTGWEKELDPSMDTPYVESIVANDIRWNLG